MTASRRFWDPWKSSDLLPTSHIPHPTSNFEHRTRLDRAYLDATIRNFLPLPARNERGEGRGEGHPTKWASSPPPSPPPREEREKTSPGSVAIVSRCARLGTIASLGVGCRMFGVGCFAAVRRRLRRPGHTAPCPH